MSDHCCACGREIEESGRLEAVTCRVCGKSVCFSCAVSQRMCPRCRKQQDNVNLQDVWEGHA